MRSHQAPSAFLAGIASGVLANFLLGISSLYWKFLAAISPLSLLCLRILSSLALLVALSWSVGQLQRLQSHLTRRDVTVHAAAAILVALNWGTFIWASIHGHVLESGFGYLLAPFLAIVAGWAFLGDRATAFQVSSVALIAMSFACLAFTSRDLAHWVYLTVGATWGGYACLKKTTRLNAIEGLLCETVVLTLLLPIVIWFFPASLQVPKDVTLTIAIMAGACGLISVVPLWLFSRAASTLPLSIMGFFQFVLPMTQVVVAFVSYDQKPSIFAAASLSVIAVTLLGVVYEQFRDMKFRLSDVRDQ